MMNHRTVYKHCSKLGLVTVSDRKEMVYPAFAEPKSMNFMVCGLTKGKCSSNHCPIKNAINEEK